MIRFRYRDLSIGLKLIIGFSAMILFCIIIGLVGLSSSKNIQNDLKDILNNRFMAMDYLIEADRDLQQLLVAERSMIFADIIVENSESDLFTNLLADYQENARQSVERWEKYKKLNPFPEEKALFTEYEHARNEWEKISREIVEHCQSESRQDRIRAMTLSLGQGKQKFEEMREYINQLEEINLDIAKKLEKQAEKSYLGQTILSIAVIILGILLGIFLIWLISDSVTKPVNNVVDIIKNIAEGDGDLTSRINIQSKDEIGDMAQWFNTFVDKLHEIVISVKYTSEQVATSTNEINATSAQFAAGAEEQMEQTEEVAASIQEMTTAIITNSEKAKETYNLAEQSHNTVNKGQQIMQETIAGMDEIVDSVKHIGTMVDSFIDHATIIEGIIKVINDIATQTNMLALNASIEAVKAGESGKGFSVVANEVQLLVDQTKDSTKKIEEIITSIQNDVEKISTSMTDVYKVVEKGKNKTMDTAKAFQKINQFVSKTREKVELITEVSEEQSIGAREISTAVTSISAVNKQSFSGSEHLAQATENLNNQTKQLKNLVEKFKLEDNR